jgi:hypothetical protein
MPLHPHELCCCGHTLEEHTKEGCQFERQYGPEERRGKNCPCKQFVWGAAAPELLEAAKSFVAWVDDVWGSAALSDKTLKEYEDAKAAIRKAKGEAQ